MLWVMINCFILWSYPIYSILLCLSVKESRLLNRPGLENDGRSGIVLGVVNTGWNITVSTSTRGLITIAATIAFHVCLVFVH